jgi:putative DNA primase/helicase
MQPNYTPPDQARPSNSSNSQQDSPNPAAPEPEPEPESPLDRLLQALDEHACKTRQTGKNQYKSQCPVHQGDGDTLKIKEEETGVLLMHCFHTDDNGEETCSNDAILDALDLTWKELFGPSGLPSGPLRSDNGSIQKPKTAKSRTTEKSKGRGHRLPLLAIDKARQDLGPPTEKYYYEDADAEDVLCMFRFEPPGRKKEFRPVHKDGDQWYLGLPPDRPLPLFHLTNILQRKTEPVFLFEGEKCADIGTELGLFATTTAHGSKCPQKTDFTPLAGRDVVIIPDHDAPGEGYARKLCLLCKELDPQPTVRILNLPGLTGDGDDIEQWL